jgi:hypothetical protein
LPYFKHLPEVMVGELVEFEVDDQLAAEESIVEDEVGLVETAKAPSTVRSISSPLFAFLLMFHDTVTDLEVAEHLKSIDDGRDATAGGRDEIWHLGDKPPGGASMRRPAITSPETFSGATSKTTPSMRR